MSTRTTIVMGVLLIALTAIFLFGKRNPQVMGNDTLFTFTQDDVQGLTIDRAVGTRPSASASPAAKAGPRTREKLEFDLQGGDWVMTSPLHTLAKSVDLSTFLGQLVDLQAEQKLDQTDKAFGFDDPDAIIEFKTKSGPHKLILGRTTVTDQGYYATVDDQPGVIVTGKNLGPMLAKSAELWRDPNAMPLTVENITRWSVVRDNQTLAAEKDKSGQWQLTQPTAQRADNNSTEQMLFQIRNIVPTKFDTDIKPGDPRLKPSITVSVWDSSHDKTPRTLVVGQQDPQTHNWYAIRSPLSEVMELPANCLTGLTRTAADLQDRHVLVFDMQQVDRLHMSCGKNELDATREGTDWTITAPAGAKDPVHKILSAVNHLHSMTWTTRLGPKEAAADHGFNTPSLTAVFYQGHDKVGTIQFGATTPKHGVYVRVAEHPELVYELSDTDLAFLRSIATSWPAAAVPAPSASVSASLVAGPTSASPSSSAVSSASSP